ncbi:Coiled-coil domain-containing protein 96 [Fasciola hepatica]|uniref:Coiled-coil domain-containing protein 96 n=1 Tax=Fasciola hepatica TaxID=6192 RepID=A0A2H1C9E3_FASHE|nr:Coiled-coil domain-containing protein 96 [Fasciola hepatica]
MDSFTNDEQTNKTPSHEQRKLSSGHTSADETARESNRQVEDSNAVEANETATPEPNVIPANSLTDADPVPSTGRKPSDSVTKDRENATEEHGEGEVGKEQLDTHAEPPADVHPADTPNIVQNEVETAVEDLPPNSPVPETTPEDAATPNRPESEVKEGSQDQYSVTPEISEQEESLSGMHRHTPQEDAPIAPADYHLEEGSGALVGQTDQFDNSESSDLSEDQEEKQQLREQLIEQYRQAVIEHKIARETNLQLQTKLAEYFRRKKADAVEQHSATSSAGGSGADGAVDYEQRYNKYIVSLTELRRQYQTMQNTYHKQIEELKNVCAQRQQEVEEAYKEFTNYKYSIGKKALHSRTGRPINPKDLLAMLAAEQKKETIVMGVRLENIKLRNEVAKVEAILKSKEELAEGLHLIDFEQLKIENQTYNEKIEERNEELAKLKKKISSTVQIMTHVKEKLQAVQSDNARQRQRLGIADAELTFNRDQLTRLKQARDHLRADNSRLRRSCGLLGKSALLFNYEDSVDAVNSKRAALEETKRITLNYQNRTKNLQEKIGSIREKGIQR